MKAPNWLNFGTNVEISNKSLQMYDNLINRNERPNHSTNNSVILGTNKTTTNVNQTTISVNNTNGYNRQTTMSSDVPNGQKKRPLSISSVSSSSSSSCSSLNRNGSLGLADTKKSYLASIESLDDADDTDDDSLGIIRMIRAKVNGCAALAVNSFQDGSPNQQTLHHSSQSQSSEHSLTVVVNTETHNKDQQTSQPSQHCHNTVPKYLDTNLSHIERVILEIVETERQYVNDLDEIIQGYLRHMKAIDDSKINIEDINNLFSNIEDIYLFNSNFFSQLEVCGLNAVPIAKCFIENSSGFNIYTHYCTNYPRTVSLLTEMMRNSETAELFKERQIQLKHSLPLGSYLLKPVQRILKYHLLLQNIVKHTEKESTDSDQLRNALSVMTNIAIHINDMKRKHEHAVRVQEIQSLLHNWEGSDLTTYGDLQCEGSFRMFGAKGFRHLFLFDRMLLITKKKDDGALAFKTHILCSNLMLIESIQGEPLCFHAIPFDQPRAQFTFQARNLDQKREWCLLLKRVILENYNVVIPTHAKQIVMQLGQTAGQSDKVHTNSKRTLSAPEYLERRKQENRRKSEPNHNLSKGFKLRKSLKKIHYMDSNSEFRRTRSSSHDDSARNGTDTSERRASLGTMDINSAQNNGSSEKSDSISNSETKVVGTGALPKQPVDRTESSGLTEEKSSDESVNQMDLSNDMHNILELRPPPRTLRIGQEMSDGPNNSNTEYVTFYIAPNGNPSDMSEESGIQMSNSSSTLYNRTSTPLSSGSSELSMASSSQSEDSKYVVLPVNALFSYSNNISGLSCPIVRRVQSFTGMTRTKAMLQHTLSLRHSLTPDLPPMSPHKRLVERPNTLNLSNCSSSSQLPTSSSLDEMSPTAPAIWLKRQEHHFAQHCKKGGSLPRSFETTSFDEINEDNCQMTPNNRPRMSEQRPFTIAADQSLHPDFIDTGIERYIDGDNHCLKASPSQDDILKGSDSPSVSLENVSDNCSLHPEHKIYRHSASKYIKSVIYNVSSKFVSLRRSPTGSDQCADNQSVLSGESGDRCESPAIKTRPNSRSNTKTNDSSKYEMSPKLITARFVHTLAKAYSNIIKNKLKNSSKIETEITASKALSEIPSPVFARISVPTANSAARMAAYNDDDCYGVLSKNRLQKRNSIKRADSLVSEASNMSMSSETEEKPDSNCNNTNNDDSPSDASDSSLDSFYERTFEAIESVLAEEMFGESGFYSQQIDADSELSAITTADNFDDIEDTDDINGENELNSMSNINKTEDIYKSIERLKCVNLNLNLKSAKRVKGAIIERLRVLEENSRFSKDINVCDFDGIKSIKERVEELENWRHNKENISRDEQSVDDSKDSPNGSPKPNSKGWVKHVIGKLQNEENQ